MAKLIIGILLIIIALAGLWFSGLLKPLLPGGGPAAAELATSTPQTQAPVSDLPTPGNDASDAALAEDAAAVQTQFGALTTDSSNINTGLSDKPIAQEVLPTGTISETVMARAKDKAARELDRRVKILNEVTTRIGVMSKVTPEFKQALTVAIQAQVTTWANLKVKIAGESDGAVLKTDVESITRDYPLFTLLVTQAHIAAAADREAKIINMLAETGGKFQARLNGAQSSSIDVSAYAAPLALMGNKLASAQTHTQMAIATSAILVPDGGDTAKRTANTKALKDARDEVEAARTDLLAAQKAADDISQGLLTVSPTASPNGTGTQ